jgi:hypothetical protein
VSYGDDFSLTMESFRGLAEHFLAKAEELCDDLMFGLSPVIDLAKVKDDLSNTQYGFSFVQHPANNLADAYLDLSTKACTTRRNGLFRDNRWDWKAIFSYRKTAESLLEMIGGVFQTDGGQVARVSELASLECGNGPSTERGLYVYNRSIIFITRHHKAKRSTNREFNVVRFLSARGGQVVFKYLVYIRRFLEMLSREQLSCPEPSMPLSPRNLLFRSDQTPDKPWDSSRFTSILKKATTEVWNIPANTQLYRQLTIGITEKHVQEVHKSFNRFDDKTAAADVNVVFAWQSGHRPIQRATTYGLDGAFPSQLQPALLRVYEWASTRWHEFLNQPSKVVLPRSEDHSRTLSSLYVQPKLGVKPAESVNDMRSMVSSNKRSPFSLPDGDSTDGGNDRPAKRRLRSRKWKQSDARLHQRHISISSGDEEPDFDGYMKQSVEEHADSDQDSTDERRRTQINTGVSQDQHQSRPNNQRAAVIAHGLDDQDDNTLIELQMEREGELRQEDPEDDEEVADRYRRLILYRQRVKRVLAQLERHLSLCALCSL